MRNLVLYILIFFSIKLLGQTDNSKKVSVKPAYNFEYIYQNTSYVSAGIGLIKPYEFDDKFPNMVGLSLNNDFKVNFNDFNMIPRLNFELTKSVLCFRLNVGIITNFKKEELIISPEIGLTAFSIVYITGGYNYCESDYFGN